MKSPPLDVSSLDRVDCCGVLGASWVVVVVVCITITVVVVVVAYLQLGRLYPAAGRAHTPSGDAAQGEALGPGAGQAEPDAAPPGAPGRLGEAAGG